MNGDIIICLSRKHCGEKRKNCLLQAISPFPTMFLKAVCCLCIKISIYGVTGYAFYHTTLTPLRKKAFENSVGKGENAGYQHFLLFPQCFLTFPKQISILES